MLTIQDLNVNLSGKSILQQINLNITEGSILGVIGPNGAGKTTLLRAISGTIPITSGSVLFRETDLARLSVMERARILAVVPQARHLPSTYTCKEAVLMGRTPHLNWLGHFEKVDYAMAEEAMQRTGISGLADRRIGETSGGEQQRILLARALAQDTSLLLLDEPTTHLDLHFQIRLLDLISELAKSGNLSEPRHPLTVILTMHDLNLVGVYADQVAVMVRGKVTAAGSPADVLTPDTLSPAFNLPLRSIPSGKAGNNPYIVPANL
jgi:iron complex transport system ATP-binding protein